MKNSFLMNSSLAAILVAFSLPALADSRIRTETYSKERVYAIYAQVGKAALVQLEADEQLKGEATALGMGVSEAWSMGVRGNNIVFKPKHENYVTNMIVVSNKRTYAFDLKPANSKNPPTYILRFHYPDTITKQKNLARKKQQAQLAKQKDAFKALSDAGVLHDAMAKNFSYFGKGSQHLAPSEMWDNGRFTYLKFNDGRDMPAIYRVEMDGSETLLNTHQENDTTVIHEVNEKIILRLGRSVLLIENRGFNPKGKFNATGTDNNQSVRLIKEKKNGTF